MTENVSANNIDQSSSEEKPDTLIGARLGEYSIRKMIGRGGMARVYEGFDERLERSAAIKVIDLQHGTDDESTQRFFREARSIAKLDHPNIVVVYQFGDGPGIYYLAMKLIEGKTLLSILKGLRKKKKYLEPETILQIMTGVASAIDYAHKNGIIHRDIKPSNIMLTPNDRPILMDFGLTMQANAESTLGTAFGTPRYIAPEQAIASHRAVAQSDIYSLGVVLYEMVTGQAPFDGDSPMSIALSHITNPPPPPRSLRPDIPEYVQLVILKALEKRPEQRWQTAMDMVEALRKAYQGTDPGVVLSQDEYDLPTTTPETIPTVQAPIPPINDETKLLSPESLPTIVEDKPSKSRRDASPVATSRPSLSIGSLRQWIFPALVTIIALALFTLFGVLTQQDSSADTIELPTSIPETKLRLIYNDQILAIYNPTGKTLTLDGIGFLRGNAAEPIMMSRFAEVNESYRNFASGQCLRIHTENATNAMMPEICGPQRAPLVLRNESDIFWRMRSDFDQVRTFSVLLNGKELATCKMQLNTCEFSMP